MSEPPQYDRLHARIESCADPIVVLEALPGMGRARLLARLRSAGLARPAAAPLAASASQARWRLIAPEVLRELLRTEGTDALGRARWLTWETPGTDPSDLPGDWIRWREWLLTPDEGRSLAERLGIDRRRDAERAFERTGGWLRPLEIALFALGSNGSLEAALGHPALDAFLRYRLAPMRLRSGADLPELPLGERIESAVTWARSSPRFGRAEDDAWRDRWTLQLLGTPTLVHHRRGEAPRELAVPFRRVLQFLALLALSPRRRCAREEMLERLWGADERRRALRNLHPTVSHLRRLLGEEGPQRILLEHGVYRWQGAEALEVDLDVFRRGARPAATLQEREEAWRVVRGDFLEGHDEAWVVDEREALRETYLELLEVLAQDYLRAERPVDAEDALRSLLAQDPLREHVVVLLMKLYRSRGRRDLVRQIFQRLTMTLQRELGIDPLEDTVRLYGELMR